LPGVSHLLDLSLTIYDFDAQKDTFAKSIFNTDVSYPGFENLVSEEVEVPGHDGAMIPLSIIYKKGIPLDGSNSCVLRAMALTGSVPLPVSVFSIRWHSEVWCLPLRTPGAAAKGRGLVPAGYKATKPNTWEDFISCAEYLVKKGYTSPQKLAGTAPARRNPDQPGHYGTPGFICGAVCNVGCANAMRLEFSAMVRSTRRNLAL